MAILVNVTLFCLTLCLFFTFYINKYYSTYVIFDNFDSVIGKSDSLWNIKWPLLPKTDKNYLLASLRSFFTLKEIITAVFSVYRSFGLVLWNISSAYCTEKIDSKNPYATGMTLSILSLWTTTKGTHGLLGFCLPDGLTHS
jgi:hypothetical protein